MVTEESIIVTPLSLLPLSVLPALPPLILLPASIDKLLDFNVPVAGTH